ncbi:hypothetical protein SOVF_202560 [Spinacia oleracea]|nr:hypothetical protein SOVF_202560 [Spinacia oleracea]
MDYTDPKRKGNVVGKIVVAAGLIAFCLIMINQSQHPEPISSQILDRANLAQRNSEIPGTACPSEVIHEVNQEDFSLYMLYMLIWRC